MERTSNGQSRPSRRSPFLEESAITYHFIDQAAISHSHDQQITHSSVKGHALQWRFINLKPQIHYRKAEKGTVNYFSKDQRISGLKRHQEVYYKEYIPKSITAFIPTEMV